jgi:hypothetical protein
VPVPVVRGEALVLLLCISICLTGLGLGQELGVEAVQKCCRDLVCVCCMAGSDELTENSGRF